MYRKNLDLAFLNSATPLTAANPIGSVDDNPWEESANLVQVKAGFGSAGCKVGAGAESAIADAANEFENLGINVTWTTGLQNTSQQFGPDLTLAASITGPAGEPGFPLSGLTDDYTGAGYYTAGSSATILIDLTASKTVGVASFFRGAGYYENPTLLTLYASTDGGSTYTVELVNTVGTRGIGQWQTEYFNAEATGYRYLRLYMESGQGAVGFFELELQEAAPASTLNTADTIELVSSGTKSFDPSELYAQIDGGAFTKAGLTGKFNIAYSLDGGSIYSSYIDAAAFQALDASIFADATTLKLSVQPVGAYIINAVRIDTIPSGTILAKTGSVTMTVDGVDVYKVETDGDVIATDISCDDINATGNLAINGKATTKAAVQTTDATPTVINAIPVAADATVIITARVTCGTAASANKNSYYLTGQFFRNAGGNVTQLGTTTSIDSNETVVAWDANFVLNTGDQTVDVTVTGEVAVTVDWTSYVEITGA